MLEQENDYFGVVENFDIDCEVYCEWEVMGGVQVVIVEYDDFLCMWIKKCYVRGYWVKDLRVYGGMYVVEVMMVFGLIVVKKGYWLKFEKILKCMQIFDVLGLFCFQFLNYEDICCMLGIVIMDQYWKDKVEIVLFLCNECLVIRRQV